MVQSPYTEQSLFTGLSMLYSCLWDYADHVLEPSGRDDVVAFDEEQSRKGIDAHRERVMSHPGIGAVLQDVIGSDYQRCLGLSPGTGSPEEIREFATYLSAMSHRYGELARS